MTEEQQVAMMELQELGFTMDDLREYLDTHLYDDFAIERFNNTAKYYMEKLQHYAATYGPLTQHCVDADETSWQWAFQDFPWDY